MALTANQDWLYKQMSGKNVDLGSEEQFAQAMQDESNRQWVYEQAGKMGIDLGTPEQFASAMQLPTEEMQAETGSPDAGRMSGGSLLGEQEELNRQDEYQGMSNGMNQPFVEGEKLRISDVQRPQDYDGDGSFYGLSDEDLNKQIGEYDQRRTAAQEALRQQQRTRKRSFAEQLAAIDNPALQPAQDQIEVNNVRLSDEDEERYARLQQEKVWRERNSESYQELGDAILETRKLVNSLRDQNGRNIDSGGASAYLDKAIELYQAPSKYGQQSGFKNWAEGLGAQLSDYDTYTLGVTEAFRAGNMAGIVKKLNKGENLTDQEQANLQSFLLLSMVEQAREQDLSTGYTIGKQSAESIPFMIEMLATAGLGAAGEKALVKSIVKSGNRHLAERVARMFGDEYMVTAARKKSGKIVKDIALNRVEQGLLERGARQVGEDVLMTAAMPTTWASVNNDRVNEMLFGDDHDYGFMDFMRSFTSATLETGTERWGGKIVDKTLNKVMPLDKIWGKQKWGKLLSNDFIQSPFGETGEEYINAMANAIRSVNPAYSDKSNAQLREEAEHMFTPSGFAQTFLTVLPMSAIGGTVNVGIAKYKLSQYQNGKSQLTDLLTGLGASTEQAENIIRQIESSEDTSGFAGKVAETERILLYNYQVDHPNATKEEYEAFKKQVDKTVGAYFKGAAYLNELTGELQDAYAAMPEEDKQRCRDAWNEYVVAEFENKVPEEPAQETTPLSPAAAEHQRAVDEVTQSVGERTHGNGYIYSVSMPGKEGLMGNIVGDVVPVIDESNPEQLRIENDDVVTVKWSDGTVTQERARDLDLIGDPMQAQQAINIEVENRMYDYTQQRIQNGEQPVLMRNSEGTLEGFFPTEGGLLEDQNGVQYTPEQLAEQGWQETKPVLFSNGEQMRITIDNGDGTYSPVDAMGNLTDDPISMSEFSEQGFAMVPLEEEQPKSQAPVEAPVVEQAPVEQAPEVQQPEVQETAAPVVPNIETMSADELGGSAVEYMGDRASAMAYLEAERDKADAEVRRTSKLKVSRFDGPEDFKRQNDQIQAAKRTAIDRYNKLQNAITAANAYKTLAEQKEEAERKAREAALREQRRQLAEAETAGDIEAKWQNTKKTVGFAATKTLPNGQKVNGHYILTEAGDVVPSHDPRKNYADSEGYVMENGQNVNDNNYKDQDVQRIATDIAQNYGGQAVEQMPFLENKAGRVLSGNNRTISGIIAAENNTDQAYLAALAENAQQYGFTPEQIAEYQHPRLQFVVEDELPFTTGTFAMFNQQEKKTKSSVNRAVANSKMVTEAVRDKMLEIMDQYESLDSFFGSESAASDIVQALITEGLMTPQEVAGLTENTATGFKFGQSGREYVTDMLLGTLFDEQTIKMLAGEKTLKQAILRALPSIVANRRLKGYELTDSINKAIQLLYEARKANEGKSTADAFQLYLRQVDAFEGSVMDRYNGFDIILANRMSAGVEQLREILGLYNNSAMNEANGQMGFFEPRTIDDIKQDVYEYYTNQQPELAAALNGAAATGAQPQSAVPGGAANEGDARQEGLTPGEQALEAAAEADQLQHNVPQRPNSKQLQGMNYTVAEAEDYIGRIVRNILDENGYEDVEIVGTKVIGSRVNGDAREDSDLDAIVEFKGDAREDSLFNLLHEDPIEIDSVKVDINPITEGKSGTIEQFMRRADEYLTEKEAAKAEQAQEDAEHQKLIDAIGQYLGSISSDGFQGVLFDNQSLIPLLKRLRIPQKIVDAIQEQVDKGAGIDGFYLLDHIFMNVDALPDPEHARSRYVHERQHGLTEHDPRWLNDVVKVAEDEELKDILRAMSNSNFYDPQAFEKKADEFISYAMEVAYSVSNDEELETVLKEYGVKEELINIIKSINNEQRESESLNRARRVPYVDVRREDNSGQGGRDSEPRQTGDVGQQGSGSSDQSTRGTEGGGQTAGEQVTPFEKTRLGLVAAEFRRQHPDAAVGILFREKDTYEFYDKDAVRAAEILGLQTTEKDGVPFLSFPLDKLQDYLGKLVRGGMKIGITRKPDHKPSKGDYQIGDSFTYDGKTATIQDFTYFGTAILDVEGRRVEVSREQLDDILESPTENRETTETKASGTNAVEIEIGGALVDRLGDMGMQVSTDLTANRQALKEAKADKSEAGTIHYFKTPSGKQYGFAYKGKVYLDPTKIDAELPLHEYGHLWAEALRRLNPENWQRVVETIRADKEAWAFVRELRPELTDENEIAEEVIATFSGKNGAEKMRAEYERMHGKDADYKSKWGNIFQNISKAIQDFWKAVGDFLNIKYESAEQVYDQVLKDFVDNMNPWKRVSDYLQARDNEYVQAAESGDIKKATNIFYEALKENIGNGITPYMSVGTYNNLKRLAKGVKTRDAALIKEAADLIAPIIPDNAVLIPAPSHSGTATDMLDLAKAIAEVTGSEVADVLRSAPRESQYQAKKATGVPMASGQLGITMEGTLPEGKMPIIIDNVVDSGNTAEACVQAVGRAVVVTIGDSAEQYRHAASLKSAAPVLRDKAGKVIPLSKRFEPKGSRYLGRRMYLSSNDPRFAISGTQVIPVTDKTLVGLHNISAEKLRKAIKMGGLANPSTAVINIATQSHEQYGDISLVMPSRLVDSKTGRNAGTFTGDIWSPTYPHVEKQMSDKGDDAYYAAITKAFGDNKARRPILSRAKLDFDDYLDSGNIRAGLAYWYLLEKGIEPGDVYFNSGISDDIKERFRPLYDKGILDLTKEDYRTLLSLIAEQQGKTAEDMLQDAQESKARYQQTIDDPEAKQFYKKIAQQAIDEIDLYGVRYNVLSNGYHAMERAIRNDGKIDLDSTLIAAQDIVQTQHQADFDKWISDMDERFDISEVLFQDYDRDGNSIYKPHTLANVSRMMNKEDLQNAGDHGGLGATRGILVKRLETLADIRAEKGRLRPGTEEDIETEEWNKMQDEWFNKVLNPLSDMQKISDNPFSNVGYAETRLQDALRTKDPIAHLNKEYGYHIAKDSQWAKDLADMVERVKNLPTKYFETKFRRPVYLNEFANAVVPNDLPQDLRAGLESAGLRLFSYDPNTQGSRRDATLEATAGEGIRFSINGNHRSSRGTMTGHNGMQSPVFADIKDQYLREMADIKDKAIKDGTFMQAPNGKPTNLDERQWLQVRTRAFKRWFGDWENDPQNASKVLDENGEPMVMYHGTHKDFTTFDKRKIFATNFGKGFYFISDMNKALAYGHYLMPVFLNVRNPLDLTTGENDAEYNKWYGKKRNPYDGYTFIPTIPGVNYTMVVAPEPNQIKSAINNNGSFSEENDDIRFSISNQNNDIFYSNAERAVEGIKQEKATPEQWRAMIEKAGGLKAGEDKWIGLSDWLAQQHPTVTPQGNETRSQFVERAAAENKRFTLSKQDLLDYIREHKIQIEEVPYAEGLSTDAEQKLEEFNAEFEELIFEGDEETGSIYTSDWVDYAWRAMVDRYGDDFESAFEIEGEGTGSRLTPTMDYYGNYSDVALYFLGEGESRPINGTRLQYTTDGLQNKREIALVVPTIESWNQGDEIHFGDAGEGRAIAWVRFGDAHKIKYGENGEELADVLVIDEIQSKRHQEGREHGYVDSETAIKYRQLEKETSKAQLEYHDYRDQLWKKYENQVRTRGEMLDVLTPEEKSKHTELQEKYENLYDRWEEFKKNIPVSAIPAAPFEKNWHELAMKRILRFAAENGYDKVAWTTGEQQAKRYDIGKEIDHIVKTDENTYEVYPTSGLMMTLEFDENGMYADEYDREYNGKSMSDIFGKDLAKRLKEMPVDETLQGDGLRVGYDGMKGFYDDILPRFMQKYGKKWGVQVGEVTMPDLEEGYQTMHAIDINDAMRESVMEGQPMFSVTGSRGAANIDKMEGVTTRMDNLAAARQMEEDGKDAKTIRMATGWERGADGKWRYEIDDVQLNTDNVKANFRKLDRRGVTAPMVWYHNKFTDIIADSPERKQLLAAYPQLADLDIEFYDYPNKERGAYSSEKKKISINRANVRSVDECRSVLLHEIQHAIQEAELFAKGTSKEQIQLTWKLNNEVHNRVDEYFDKMGFKEWLTSHNGDKAFVDRLMQVIHMFPNRDFNIHYLFVETLPRDKQIDAIDVLGEANDVIQSNRDAIYGADRKGMTMKPDELYHNAAGEVESRNVQNRMNLTPEERRERLLTETEDVAREDQVVIMNAFDMAEEKNMLENLHISDKIRNFAAKFTRNGEGFDENNHLRSAGRDGSGVLGEAAGRMAAAADRSDIRVLEPELPVSDRVGYFLDLPRTEQRARTEAESQRLIAVAKSNNQFVERKDLGQYGDKLHGNTRESTVFVSPDRTKHIKVKDPFALTAIKGNYPEDAIYEHLIHNLLFPDTRYTFMGISEDLGDVRIILSQETVDAIRNATDKEVDERMRELGLRKVDPYTYENEQVRVTDVTGDNALVDKDGNVRFIDPVISLKVPAQRILDDIDESDSATEHIRFAVSGNYQSRNSIVTEALVKQANDSFRLMQSALKKVSADLRTINAIRTQQFEYDRKVVDMLLDLYNSLLQENSVWAGYMPDTTRRIATQIVHAIGKKDISTEVNTIMDHMVHAQAKAAQRQWDKLRQTPIDKINISGVVMQGKVALQGQHALKAMNEALDARLSVEQLEDQIAQLMDMEDNATDESLKLQYKGQWIGYTIAAQHLERIQHLVDERNQLDIELQAARSNRAIKQSARQQLVANIQQAMRDNFIAQADAYAQSAKDLAEYVTTQEEQAKDFIHRQDANRDKIRSYAQRDLEGLATNPNRDRTRGNIARQIWDAFASPIRDLQSLLRLTGLHAPDGEGYLYNHFMRGWMDGADKERLGIVNASKTLDAKISELTHGKYKTWEEAARKVDDASHNMFTITMLNGVDGKDMPVEEEIPLNAGNALYIYAVNKMTDGRMKLAGMNITEEEVKALVDDVRERFGQEILDVVDWVQSEYFSQLRNRYNPTHEALFGAPMDAIENYFPLRINANARQQNEDLSEPDTDAARLLAGTSTCAIKRRTKNSLPLDVRNADFFQEVIRHISQMERWNAFAQWNRDANILFSDINFRNRIKGMNGTIYGSGDKLYNYMKDAFRVAIGTYKPKTDTFSEITLNVAKGVTSAKINFRIWTAMKQIASFPAFFTYMQDGVFVGSYLRNWLKPHETMKWAKEHLPNFEKRVSKRDMGDMRLMQRTTDWQWNKRILELSSKYGMYFNVLFDTLTCATGARAVYDSRYAEYIKKGYSLEQAEQRARQDAEQAFNTSQQSSEGAFMSAVQMDRNLVTAALTVFRTSPIQYTRNFMFHTRNLLRKFGRGSKDEQITFRMGQYKNDGLSDEQARNAAEKDYNKSIRADVVGFVVYGALLNLLWRLVGQVPYLLFGDDDDKKKQILEDATSGGAWFSPFTGLLGGGIVESALDGNGSVADMFAPEMPFTQDVKRAGQYLENNKYAEFVNQALSVAMQSGTGFDPQTAADMIQRVVTTIDSEEELSAAEEAIRISQALLSIPQSQYEQQLVDRVVTDESEYEAALADYIRYQKVHTAPLTWWLRGEESDEKAEENAERRFDRLLKERDELHNPEDYEE